MQLLEEKNYWQELVRDAIAKPLEEPQSA